MIDIKDIITLSDDNKYGVVSKTVLDGKTYYYLVDVNHHENLKFCYEKNSGNELKLVEIEDKALIQKLIPLLASEIKDEVMSLLEEKDN